MGKAPGKSSTDHTERDTQQRQPPKTGEVERIRGGNGDLELLEPQAPEVMLAASEAESAGNSARYSMRPATSTSIAKTVAASGVRKSPAKPAAMPISKNVLLGSRKGRRRPIQYETVAPICTATPSRPALPPKRCVAHVLSIMSGTKRGEMASSRP